jgi:hypothetical protein
MHQSFYNKYGLSLSIKRVNHLLNELADQISEYKNYGGV